MKRASSMLTHKQYDFECMSYSEVISKMPKDDEIPDIVESIFFWENLIIKNPKSPVEHEQNKISAKNAKLLLNMLEKSPKVKVRAQSHFYNKMKKEEYSK